MKSNPTQNVKNFCYTRIMMSATSFCIILFHCIVFINCDWIEIPHITKNSHSYPAENFEAIFLKPKTTLATVATTAVPKKIYSKDTFSEVLERPPHKNVNDTNKTKNGLIKNNKLVQQSGNTEKPKPTVAANRRSSSKPKEQTNNTKRKHVSGDFNEKGRENMSAEYENYDDEYDEYVEYEEYDQGSNGNADANQNAKQNGTSFGDLFPFFKTIQDSLINTVQSSTSGKIGFLQNLRDNLLYSLKDRITNLWASRDRRGAREHKEEYHIDTNEGPLITIGFLTFAAFLIKLVLQLINAFRIKQGLIMVPTTTTAATLILGRRKRSEELDEKSAEIYNLIDDYERKNINY